MKLAAAQRTTNRLLLSLPKQEREKLLSKSEMVHLARRRIIYETAQPITNVYFLSTGMASLFAVAEDGRTVQIAVVGSDGFLGGGLSELRKPKSTVRIITQSGAEGIKVDVQQFAKYCSKDRKLREVLLSYSQVLQAQIAQSALCNSLHNIRQRLCRWLLVCSDASQSLEFDLTQEDLANMLGSHRNQISAEARELGRRGFIRYARGSITIVEKNQLEQTSCECYRVVRRWERELLNI